MKLKIRWKELLENGSSGQRSTNEMIIDTTDICSIKIKNYNQYGYHNDDDGIITINRKNAESEVISLDSHEIAIKIYKELQAIFAPTIDQTLDISQSQSLREDDWFPHID